jgi:hypothetical protein
LKKELPTFCTIGEMPGKEIQAETPVVEALHNSHENTMGTRKGHPGRDMALFYDDDAR